MVLTGEGSDEILGGYPKHVFERFAHGYQMIPGARAQQPHRPAHAIAALRFRRAKTAIANLNIEDWHERYVRWFGALSRGERDELSVLRLNGTPRDDLPPFDAEPGSRRCAASSISTRRAGSRTTSSSAATA
jgi:asparagine synthase (glutamine-hydrolysing)